MQLEGFLPPAGRANPSKIATVSEGSNSRMAETKHHSRVRPIAFTHDVLV